MGVIADLSATALLHQCSSFEKLMDLRHWLVYKSSLPEREVSCQQKLKDVAGYFYTKALLECFCKTVFIALIYFLTKESYDV